MPLTPEQCRAARAQAGLSQTQLAQAASVALKTLSDYETGKTSPRTKTIGSLKNALEEAGATFIVDEGPGGSSRGVSMSANSFVDATDLKLWAARQIFHGLLPEVLRRLIAVAAETPQIIDFPRGDSTQVGGWDGIVEGASATQFIPEGVSGWEMGCDATPKKKANSDYDKRAKNPLGLKQERTTFVFVTPRLWPGKKTWAKEKCREGRWADVRALDADDLEQWLSHHPGIGIRLAIEMGKLPRDIETLSEFWQGWRSCTTRPLHPSIVLGGRDVARDKIRDWVNEAPKALYVQAETAYEATAFLAAMMEEEVNAPLCLRLQSREAVRAVGGRTSKMIIVAPEDGSAIAEQALALGHHVYIPLGHGGLLPQGQEGVLLPIPGREYYETALKDSGFSEEEAERLRMDSARSLAVLQRQLGAHGMPAWTRPEHGRNLIPILLAGAWEENVEGDKEAVARLAGRDYEEVVNDLTRWSHVPDPPLRNVDGTWRLKAPREAWLMLGRYLTAADMERFKAVLVDVLGENDPTLDMPAEDRWLANVRGKTIKHSKTLREGIVNAMTLLSVFGPEAKLSAVNAPARWVDNEIQRLLHGADGLRWYALSSLLRFLAEASPEAFLDAVEDSLRQPEPPLAILFEHEKSSHGFGGINHSSLLWGLEGLAWDPVHLTRVTLILGQLTRFEVAANIGNNPRQSLKDIHLLWLNHTAATVEQRMAAIDRLLDRHPKPGWQLLIDLHPSGHDITSNTHRMRWRQLSAPALPPATNHDLFLGAQEVRTRVLREVGADTERWQGLINEFDHFPSEQKAEIIKRLNAMGASDIPEDDRVSLADAIRKLVARHRAFPDAEWSMPMENTDALADAYERIAPRDPILRNRWLFDSRWIELMDGTRPNEDEAADSARLKALQEIHEAHGHAGLLRLAQLVKDPWLVGCTVGAHHECDEENWDLICEGLSSTPELSSFARALIGQCAQREGAIWVEQKIERLRRERNAEAMLTDFFLSLPCESETWNRLAELGDGVAKSYWTRISAYAAGTEGEISFVIEQLLAVDRPKSALSLVAYPRKPVPSQILTTILSALAENPTTEEGLIEPHKITAVFEALDKAANVDDATMIGLEWAYAEALNNFDSKRKTVTIHKRLAESPGDFVQMLCFGYNHEDEEKRKEEDAERTKKQKEQIAARAHDVLFHWHAVPGTNSDGTIDFDALWQWVEAVRSQAAAAGRTYSFASQFGQALAYAPTDTDGYWPDTAVCEAIERLNDPDVERSLHMGLFNKRGVIMRESGGDQERELAIFYQQQADMRADRFPRTATVLRDMAQTYLDDAVREDNRAQRRDLES